MREVTPENAAEYLRESGRVPPGKAIEARAMGWGVSNVVIRVDVEGEPPIVLKQARERLRTKALWVSRLDRIWNEREALGVPPGRSDVIGAGAVILDRVLARSGAPRLTVSDSDILDGIAWSIA